MWNSVRKSLRTLIIRTERPVFKRQNNSPGGQSIQFHGYIITMYTERKISLQYAQPFSWLKLDEKDNFIKNLERARGEGGLKIYDSTLKFL